MTRKIKVENSMEIRSAYPNPHKIDEQIWCYNLYNVNELRAKLAFLRLSYRIVFKSFTLRLMTTFFSWKKEELLGPWFYLHRGLVCQFVESSSA